MFSAEMLSSPFKSRRRYFFGAAFYSRRQEDNWRVSNFLELATALFHGNAETKISALHRKMIIRVIKSHERGSPSFAGAIGELGPDNCFAVAGMDLRDIQSGKVA
ncbi:hypothetical protein ACCT30_21490 [Rhizobium ruizarguesonis]